MKIFWMPSAMDATMLFVGSLSLAAMFNMMLELTLVLTVLRVVNNVALLEGVKASTTPPEGDAIASRVPSTVGW